MNIDLNSTEIFLIGDGIDRRTSIFSSTPVGYGSVAGKMNGFGKGRFFVMDVRSRKLS